mgnify:CR=1 FL=1
MFTATPTEITDKSSLLFQILWKGNIAFSVEGWKHFGWFLVKKNGQQVSALFHYNKINDITISTMQNVINEIEYGKYDNKIKVCSFKIPVSIFSFFDSSIIVVKNSSYSECNYEEIVL